MKLCCKSVFSVCSMVAFTLFHVPYEADAEGNLVRTPFIHFAFLGVRSQGGDTT